MDKFADRFVDISLRISFPDRFVVHKTVGISFCRPIKLYYKLLGKGIARFIIIGHRALRALDFLQTGGQKQARAYLFAILGSSMDIPPMSVAV